MKGPLVLLESLVPGPEGKSWRFHGFREIVAAVTPAEVLPALHRVEELVESGLHAAGFIAYEAAAAFDPALAVHPPGDLPLLWFAIFSERLPVTPDSSRVERAFRLGHWEPSLTREEYCRDVENIRELIAAGDTYQVNSTFRLRANFEGDPLTLYHTLRRAQRAPFCAFIDTGRHQVLSASPELFFSLRDGVLTTRPMKGTAPRGRWLEEDRALRDSLRESSKERAENLMIVDLLRNDLGMVAETGSVQVPSMFDVETLETVHQMTSTVTARLRPGLGISDIMGALFPCGSVTGAPKKRTMEIIRELEDLPRGIYTGCIGYISPGQEAVFSVAIRTVVTDWESGAAELGVGSGITWDSQPEAEYDECLAKGRFARLDIPEFSLIETLLHEPGKGYFLLERHLARLARSAEYFRFPFDRDAVLKRLEALAPTLPGRQKVRLLLDRSSAISLESAPIDLDPEGAELTVTLAAETVDSTDPFLYHKTTHRPLYTAELPRHPGCADAIFMNERGEVTEGANHNVVARIDGSLVTPALPCGLLPGTFREELLARGEIVEGIIMREDLRIAEELWLINSVRGWRKVRIV
ncbi:MAG: aminodeoxychorismate synthase component I [Geobacter sp.]|nr:aminodeoxychorismate synthase component I [Geobacter sp.]